ncbi:MAG: hypothetical protein M3Y40_08380 [Chloroflexota bacterium]|nr:hypothetical protein [Chloroflexota bacterium]
MTHPIRSIFALTILTIVLVACGTTVGAPASEVPEPSEPATPSVQPSVQPSVAPSVAPEPSEPAPEERETVGTITMAEMAFSGPGGTIAEAIAGGDSGEYPNLVNGVLFRDTDGTIYLATSLSDAQAPTFEGPMLEVLNMPNDGPSWDIAFADDIGLEQANGILFRQEAQVLGFLDVK